MEKETEEHKIKEQKGIKGHQNRYKETKPKKSMKQLKRTQTWESSDQNTKEISWTIEVIHTELY